MSKNNEVAKLRHENEVLKRELSGMRSKNSQGVIEAPKAQKVGAKETASSLDIITTFKYLKGDLTKTALLSLGCVAIIFAVYLLENNSQILYTGS